MAIEFFPKVLQIQWHRSHRAEKKKVNLAQNIQTIENYISTVI